jgi:hypothetical protein
MKKIILLLIVLVSSSGDTAYAYAEGSTIVQSGATYVANQTVVTQNVGGTQNGISKEKTPDILDALVQQGIALTSGVLGIGVTALIAWMRRRGIPVSSEQEKMFKEVITRRYESLAKQSWATMRDNPDKMNEYWKSMAEGKIPDELVKNLKDEGMKFAMELKKNKEFRDFAKGITAEAMERLTKDLRTNLKSNYQKRMIDVIPKLASIAVESSLDSDVNTIEQWTDKSLEKLRPLLLSAEAIDTEENLRTVLKSEINKRIQSGWQVKIKN